MFNKKNDPLVESVKKVMEQNETIRQVTSKLNEELGIVSKKALPFEHHANYDALLEQRIQEALHPNQQKLDVHEPEKDKLTAQDFKMLRAKKKPMQEEQLSEVSKNLLRKYREKAISSRDENKEDAGMAKAMGSSKQAKMSMMKAANRELGRKTAERKIEGSAKVKATNEEAIDEASYSAKSARAGKDIGKPGNMFSKIAKEAGQRYGSEERGKKVAGAVLTKLRSKNMEEANMDPSYHGSSTVTKDNKPVSGPSDIDSSPKSSLPKTGPMPPKRPAELKEKAPEGAKFERMVKHIKAKYAKDGLTKKEKSIAYATAWKAKKREMKEDNSFNYDEVMEEIRNNLGEDAFNAMMEQSASVVARDNLARDPVATLGSTKKDLPGVKTQANLPAMAQRNLPGASAQATAAKTPAERTAAFKSAAEKAVGSEPAAPSTGVKTQANLPAVAQRALQRPPSAREMEAKANASDMAAGRAAERSVPVEPPKSDMAAGRAAERSVPVAAPKPANVPTPPPRPATPAPAARPAPAATPTPPTPAQSFAARNTDAAIKRSDWYTGAGGGGQ